MHASFRNNLTVELGAKLNIVTAAVNVTRIFETATSRNRALASLASSAMRVVDKTPFHFMHIGYIRRHLPNARIVLCRRDNEDVAFVVGVALFRLGRSDDRPGRARD